MGGSKPWPQVPVRNEDHTSAAVVIIGAGFSGICTAIDLIRQNKCHNFVILEKSSSVGGTWYDQKYPGCACDVWSILYSFSFEQNPQWSRDYPGQEEMLDYLISVASKYNLFRYIRFNSSVDSAAWDDETQQWKSHVKIQGSKEAEFGQEYTISSDFLVSAVGQLNVPKSPDIEGLDTFQGRIMHSARWDWKYDIRGKRCAILGNGATAVQIIPEVAKAASHLTIHQRTPNWVISRLDRPVPPLRNTLYAYIPFLQRLHRSAHMSMREYLHRLVDSNDSDVSHAFRTDCLANMHAALPDRPDLRAKLTPAYAVGCKRVCVSDDFYPAIARSNVTLETGKIQRITPSGIQSAGHPVSDPIDLLILATGFQTQNFLSTVRVSGRKGRSLQYDVWADGAAAYKGVTVQDMPNFAILYGPNTNLGHNSIVVQIEAQSRYINTLIGAVLDARGTVRAGSNQTQKEGGGIPGSAAASLALTPKAEVVRRYNDKLQARLATKTFADPACASWYKDPATGRITNNWVGNCVEYQELLSEVDWEGEYEGGNIVVGMRKGKGRERIGRVVEELGLGNGVLVGGLVSILGVAAAGVGWGWRRWRVL